MVITLEGRISADRIIVDIVDGVEFELDVKGLYKSYKSLHSTELVRTCKPCSGLTLGAPFVAFAPTEGSSPPSPGLASCHTTSQRMLLGFQAQHPSACQGDGRGEGDNAVRCMKGMPM